MTLGSTTTEMFKLRLPPGNGNTSLINVIVHVRDVFDAVNETHIATVPVTPDMTEITEFIEIIKNRSIITSVSAYENSIVQLLFQSNLDVTTQVITIVSQMLNEINIKSMLSTDESR